MRLYDYVIANPNKNWNYQELISNPNLSFNEAKNIAWVYIMNVYILYIQSESDKLLPINEQIQNILNNPKYKNNIPNNVNIKYFDISKYIKKITIKPKLDDLDILSKNPNISISDILQNVKYCWDWSYLTKSPHISGKDILENIHLPWNLNNIYKNNNLTLDEMATIIYKGLESKHRKHSRL
jgi:hypothetical protein